MARNGYHGDEQRRYSPTAVTAKDSIAVINVLSNGSSRPRAFLMQVATRLDRCALVVHLMCSSNQSLSFAVSYEGTETQDVGITQAVAELSELGVVTVARNMSIITVVGHKLRNLVGVDGESYSGHV